MRVQQILRAAVVGMVAATVFSASAISAPLRVDLSTSAPTITDKVWCRYGGCDGGVGVGALVGGLVGGAIIAGAAAQQNAAAAQQQQQHVSYCAQRYRSYDPASDTFQGRDGRRYACQ